MSSSSYHRDNDRSNRRSNQASHNPSGRPPSSSHFSQRPSPHSSATLLWGPALWNNLLAAGRTDHRTPTLPSDRRPTRPVSPPRLCPARSLRNRTPTYLYESSDTSSDKDLGDMTVTTRQTKKAKIPPVIEKKSATKSKNTSPKKVNNTKTIVTPRKRTTPDDKQDALTERPSKVQKTEQMGTEATTPKQKVPRLPILLDDSDGDIPLAHPLPKRSEAAPRTASEEAPQQNNAFPGLGIRSLRNDSKESSNDLGHGAANAADDFDVQSPITPFKRSTRSASKNLDLHQNTIRNLDSNAGRVAELENELAKCKRDFEARIETIQREHERATQQSKQEHEAQIENMRREHEAKLQQNQLDHDAQAEALRQETKSCLDDIQQTVASQDDQKSKQIDVLKTENRVLKDQLEAEKAASDRLIKTLDQREMLVPTEDSFKALEARNTALSHEVELLKRQLSPTSTPASSFQGAEEKKSTNLRSAYLKTKKKLDNLFTIIKKLDNVTSGIDLGAFGEFGKYLKDLKKFKEDELDDVGSGSQVKRGGTMS